MLEQGSYEKTDFRDASVETWGLLHYGRFRVQGSVCVLNRGFRTLPYCSIKRYDNCTVVVTSTVIVTVFDDLFVTLVFAILLEEYRNFYTRTIMIILQTIKTDNSIVLFNGKVFFSPVSFVFFLSFFYVLVFAHSVCHKSQRIFVHFYLYDLTNVHWHFDSFTRSDDEVLDIVLDRSKDVVDV